MNWKKKIEVTEGHIKLVRRMYVESYYDGYAMFDEAPLVNVKRPFGNSDIPGDMIEILGLPPLLCEDPEGDYTNDIMTQLETIYNELPSVLGIVLELGTFEPGVYETDENGFNWKKIG